MRLFRPYGTLLVGIGIGAFVAPWAMRRFNIPNPLDRV